MVGPAENTYYNFTFESSQAYLLCSSIVLVLKPPITQFNFIIQTLQMLQTYQIIKGLIIRLYMITRTSTYIVIFKLFIQAQRMAKRSMVHYYRIEAEELRAIP